MVLRSSVARNWELLSRAASGVFAILALAGVAAIVVFLTRHSMSNLLRAPGAPAPGSIVSLVLEGDGRLAGLFVVGLVVRTGVAPVIEELLYRGFVFPPLVRKFGPGWAGVLVTAAWVLSRHRGLSGTVALALFGALLLRLFYVSGSLVPSIVLHMAWNVGVNTLAVVLQLAHPEGLIVPFTIVSVAIAILAGAWARRAAQLRE